jgi:mannose-6-phosphate isomerase-like protein (cupin superfamily)
VNDGKRILTVRPHDGEALFVLGDVVTFKLTGEDSDHAYFLTEIMSVPGGGPAFLHTHVPQETLWIVEGEYEVYGQDENGDKYAIEATPGTTVHVPGDVPHGFRNVGDTTGRLLALYAPVVHQTEFFREIGVAMESSLAEMPFDQMPSNERILEVLAKHEMRLLEDLPEG